MSEWIPVNKSLPKHGQAVLICYELETERRVAISYFDKHRGFLIINVLAWMPLPEPYKAESEGLNADSN